MVRVTMKPVVFAILLILGLTSSLAQQVPPPKASDAALREFNERLKSVVESKEDPTLGERQDYTIGPEDQLDISVFEVPELSRTVRVSAAGEISLPLIGSVKAAGKSPMQLEQKLRDLLRKTYIKDPQVNVFLREFHSDPVSVVGAVKMPGLYHIQTRKSLVEILAMAQGFSEGARQPGKSIVITRKLRPQEAGAAPGGVSSSGENDPAHSDFFEVPIKELMQSGDRKWNVPIYPGDVVKVVPAGTVYVAGSVTKPGSFPLTDFENISAIQALAMAGGTTKSASSKNALIIHTDAT
jgi:polysaccharide export outer membrane protein